jgi:hypothetical protein
MTRYTARVLRKITTCESRRRQARRDSTCLLRCPTQRLKLVSPCCYGKAKERCTSVSWLLMLSESSALQRPTSSSSERVSPMGSHRKNLTRRVYFLRAEIPLVFSSGDERRAARRQRATQYMSTLTLNIQPKSRQSWYTCFSTLKNSRVLVGSKGRVLG